MDQELLRSLGTNGIFAMLFGYLGLRHLKMADEDRKWIRDNQERLALLLDRVTQRLDK